VTARRLRYVPLDEVTRAITNPKLHAGEQIAASMDRFGFLEPVLHDGRTGRLIAGHGRLEELLRRRDDGDGAPPEGILVGSDGVWKVPVVYGWSSRDDAEAHAAGVALNRIVEMGGWNVPELYGLLEQLAADDLPGVGFSAEQRTDLLKMLEPERFGGTSGGARTDTSLDAKAETYRTNGIRSLVLDFPLDEYERMQEALRALRKARGAETNAVVVAQLLREAEAAL
jgi:hypothetical protein